MCLSDKYKTIQGESTGIYKEKGSKFYAHAIPVITEKDIEQALTMLRKKYHDARHHCYAYQIGLQEEQKYRANDDGEPSNTAGQPILGQIHSFSITNVLIVVVRYFGGILLGTGGLIRAYKSSAFDALNHAQIITKTAKNTIIIHFDYPEMNDVMSFLKQNNLPQINQNFDLSCEIITQTPKSETQKYIKMLNSINNVKTQIK